jgi:hypothetical protein
MVLDRLWNGMPMVNAAAKQNLIVICIKEEKSLLKTIRLLYLCWLSNGTANFSRWPGTPRFFLSAAHHPVMLLISDLSSFITISYVNKDITMMFWGQGL